MPSVQHTRKRTGTSEPPLASRSAQGQGAHLSREEPVAPQWSPASPKGPLNVSSPTGVTLIEDVLRSLIPGLSREKAKALAPHLARAMSEAGICTPRQQAAFMAQCAHESCGFKVFKELGGESYFRKYEGRKDLGNTQPGDGARYKGRGALQLTGRANYLAASKALFNDDRLVERPELVEQPQVAFAVSAWFWRTRKLNAIAEAGDFRLLTRRINGGLNGLEERLNYYRRALSGLGGSGR